MTGIREKLFSGKKVDSQILFLGVIIIVFIVVVTLINPRFMTVQNFTNLFKQISVTGICSVAMALVLISGGFDLSIGSMLSMIGCIIGTLINSGVPEVGAMTIGVLCGVAAGAANGAIIAKSRCAPIIITPGTMGAFKGVALLIAGGNIINFKAPTPLLSNVVTLGIPTIVFILAFVGVAIFLFLKFTVMGRRIYAIGSSQEASYLSGVNITMSKIFVYMMSGLIISFASIALLMRLGSASAVMGDSYTLSAVAAAVIGGVAISGGRGSMIGCFLGIFLLGLISNAMNIIGVSTYLQDIVLGLIVVVAAVVSQLGNKDS